jgi:hypothetical protein
LRGTEPDRIQAPFSTLRDICGLVRVAMSDDFDVSGWPLADF